MDPLGQISRDFLKQQRSKHLKIALVLGKDFKKQGMKADQVEEMLYANEGFDSDVIAEVVSTLFGRKK